MRKLWRFVGEKLNNYSIKKKLLLFYVCCVLIPLFLTDGVLLVLLYHSEMQERQHEYENIATAIESELSYTFEETAKIANTIYLNRSVNEFLNKRYHSDLDFYVSSLDIEQKTFYEVSGGGSSTTKIVMCSDNDTLINGDHFYRLQDVRNTGWYQKLQNSDLDMVLHFYYIGKEDPSAQISRRVSLVRKLDYFKDLKSEKLVRLDLDYSSLVRKLNNNKYDVPVYICCGDQILYSNIGFSSTRTDFAYLTGAEEVGYSREFTIYGEDIRILVMEKESDLFGVLKQHMPLFYLMLTFNIVFPCILAVLFNHSLVSRLAELSAAFDEVEAESLKEIEKVRGKDEIGSLMHNYNRMVHRSRELIKTVYKDRMEKQQMDIARQNAELLALHSQIDPHFLFNVLEGIRMHSVLKGETETAEMIQRVAVLERENVNWKKDMVSIREEVNFIETYLELQKHRFGERLKYELDMEEDCLDFHIPKMTLVTFVENACVHGVEKKAATTWIYVRVYRKGELIYLEIEDTGAGIEEEEVKVLLERMKTGDIETLRQSAHIGVANACLRLRMVTKEHVEFELESEPGIGTLILIKIPEERLRT